MKELGCQIVTQLIIDRYKHLQEDKLVFGKMNYWSMCKKLKTVMTACGIEKAISYHCGRHSFATLALSKGMPIESVSRVLGHTNIVTTQIYAKITSQKLDNDNSSSPLRESVVRIKPNTTMDDLMRYAQKVYERWGVRAIQIHIHRDEGHYADPDDPESWITNLHAHIIWDWMNHDTGKSYKLNSNDCMQIQNMVADSLGMERGVSKEETGAEHLMRNDYILQKQKKELNELKEQTEEAQNDLQTTIDDCNLLQTEKEYARDLTGFASGSSQ